MALVLLDRAQESATANTTVSFTMLGAAAGYQSLSSVGNTNTTYYGATDGTNWEVGIGTYTLSTTTLARTTVLSSSNAGSAVTFASGAGAVTVFIDYPSSKSVYQTGAFQGTIDNTVIGGTTPAAGTFTTATVAQPQNLITYSQTFQNAAWTKQTNVTATDNTTVAPDGTTTAATISWASASNNTGIYNNYNTSNFSGINTKSIYVRADVAGGTVELADPGLTSGVTTATLTTSWQRVVLTEQAGTQGANSGIWFRKTASSPSTVYVWGGQLERASSAGVYAVTTATRVISSEQISFNGVAGLTLDTLGNLAVSPYGTGALQAQATTSTTVGGNARGANAVDWQTSRNAASQVASGSQTVLVGGQNNTVASSYCALVGGVGNTSNGFGSFLGSGNANSISGSYGAIGSGNSNTATKDYASVLGGQANAATGYYNFIGNGFTNAGTANAAVTTQSGTMNATTAVTLSGSNASIKVGQYITGTSIAGDTYVAAISGTALTLSKVASGSSTSTLSFFTPHGVVVGGGNNQATGSYSFIGGGGDAGTAANRNVASGDWSFVGGGANNRATGLGSTVAGGGFDSGFAGNLASGNGSAVGGGLANQATGAGSIVAGGYNNIANSSNSAILGGYYGSTRSIVGMQAAAACLVPIGYANGISQSGLLILAKETTNATATVLCSNPNAAGTTNQVILPNNSAYYFKGSVISNVTGAANGAAWSIEGAIMRGANAASTVLIGTPQLNRVAASAGATAWTIAITADTTNGGLAITVTGVAGTTIRWVAKLETTEVTY